MAFPAAAALAAQQGNGDLVSGLTNGFWNLRGEHQQMDMAGYMAVLNQNLMAWQAQLQHEQAAQAHEYQKELLGLQAEYNSPKYLMGQAKEAGLNPNVLFGKGSSPTAGSAPSVGTPAAGLAGVSSPGGRAYFPFAPSGIGELAGALASAAEAEKKGAETSEITALLFEKLRGLTTENDLKQAQLDFTRIYGNEERAASIISKYAEAFRLVQEGDEAGARKFLVQAQTATEKQREKLSREQVKELNTKNDFLARLLESEINKNNSEAGKAKQEGRNFEASAIFKEFENKVRDSVGISTFASREISETEQAKIKTLYDKMDLDKQEKILSYVIEQARFAVESNDITKSAYWSSLLKSMVGNVAAAAILAGSKKKP